MFFNVFIHIHILLFYSIFLLTIFINARSLVILYVILAFFWDYVLKLDVNFYWIMIILMLYLNILNIQPTFYFKPSFSWKKAFKLYLNNSLDFLKYITKKYIYTINHKRIAINYLVFCMWSGLSGATLATMIRWELAYPGSHF